jgi:hypothetical protein
MWDACLLGDIQFSKAVMWWCMTSQPAVAEREKYRVVCYDRGLQRFLNRIGIT